MLKMSKERMGAGKVPSPMRGYTLYVRKSESLINVHYCLLMDASTKAKRACEERVGCG